MIDCKYEIMKAEIENHVKDGILRHERLSKGLEVWYDKLNRIVYTNKNDTIDDNLDHIYELSQYDPITERVIYIIWSDGDEWIYGYDLKYVYEIHDGIIRKKYNLGECDFYKTSFILKYL